jgi:hypothetical protein
MFTHDTFYVVKTNDSIYEIPMDTSKSTDYWFIKLAKTIAFDDCSDEQVILIVHNGHELHYTGWQPNMLIEFADDEENIIWSGSFPDWDH